MDALQQIVRVSFSYPVVFTTGVFAPTNPVLRDQVTNGVDPAPADVVVVLDDGVARAHPQLIDDLHRYFAQHADALRLSAPVFIMPGGEACKNDAKHTADLHDLIHRAKLCRHSYVIAIGGGALLDVAGYAAATAHRGIRLIRVPTTVLSQDDSAVGVKNGINAFGKKNYFGTFAPPFAVINDFAFLATLELRDWLSGVSEAVKAALIRDAGFFAYLEQHARAIVSRDARVMEQVVRRSAALHCAHIANGGDPFELGSSRPLDFGHWSAHKLEQLSDNRLRHGEAVAVGVALDCTYARLQGLLGAADWRRILDVLIALQLPVWVPEMAARVEALSGADGLSVLAGLAEFREHLGGHLTIMMLRGIGDSFDVHEVDTGVMARSIALLKDIERARSTGVVVPDDVEATLTRGV